MSQKKRVLVVIVQARRTCSLGEFEGGVGLPVLGELADYATVFLNVVIGTFFSRNTCSPEDIIMEENELLVALHFTAADPTTADWIDFCVLPSSRSDDRRTQLDAPALVRSRDGEALL